MSGCTALTRENVTLGVTGPSKTSSLAFAASSDFGIGLTRREWGRLARAELKALDFVAGGKAQSWGQPSGRARGAVTVSQPFSIASRECRRFGHVVFVKGVRDTVTGVACRTGQGPWTLVS